MRQAAWPNSPAWRWRWGLGSLAVGYVDGLIAAAVLSLAGAMAAAL